MALDIVDEVYDYVKELPATEKYNLIDQMHRCSCSIPSNIAEGSGKRTNLHFAEFLSTSLSSSYELETQLIICERRKYGNPELLNRILHKLDELQRMLFVFRENILSKPA